MTKIINFLESINNGIGRIVCWFGLMMLLLQFFNVVLRYVFGMNYIFLNEGVLYLHATLFMLGAGYTLMVDKHVRVDIFYSKLSVRNRALVDLFGHLIFLLPSMVILFIYTWPTVKTSWMIFEGPVSVGGFLLKSLISLFCVLIIIQGVANLLKDCIVLFDRNKVSQ